MTNAEAFGIYYRWRARRLVNKPLGSQETKVRNDLHDAIALPQTHKDILQLPPLQATTMTSREVTDTAVLYLSMLFIIKRSRLATYLQAFQHCLRLPL